MACIELCDVLLSLKNKGYKRIVIPSRGAYPFYYGAISSLHLIADLREIMEITKGDRLFLLPFTSDWGKADIEISSSQMRKFWVKILADSIRREKTPYTIFYEMLVKIIGAKYTINTSDLLLDKRFKQDNGEDEKFIFIDTAISGRAICEIIDGFNEFDLKDFYIILIVDENGSKLRPEFLSVIEKEKSKGRLKQINVERIFSEDSSPILNSGISSLVFPSLMEHAFYEIKEFHRNDFIGAGLWFVDSISHLKEYNPNLNGIRGIFHSAIFSGISEKLIGNNQFFEEILERKISQALKWGNNINLFDSKSTKQLVYDRITTRGVKLKETVDVSNSHVIRINHETDEINNFVKKVNKAI